MSVWNQYHAFAWETDDKWKQYLNNLTIPTNISPTQNDAIINKYKRKYFEQNVSKLPEFEPKYELVIVQPKTKHTATLLFMHGIGDSGDGWGETFEQYSRHFPYLKVICPSAHTRPVTRFGGQEAPAWCDAKASAPQLINGFQSIPSSEEDSQGFQETISNLREIIQNEMDEFNIPSERIVIGGFSQGGSVSLYLGLSHEKKFAGIVAMSTYLYQRDQLTNSASSSGNLGTPLFMTHGNADQIVIPERGRGSFEAVKTLLDDNGKDTGHLEFKEYNRMGHNDLTSECLRDVVAFIKQRVPV